VEQALTDIALRGLEASRALVDRFVQAVDEPLDGPDVTGATDPTRVSGLSAVWAGALRSAATAWEGQAGRPTVDGQPVMPTLHVGGAGGVVLPIEIDAGATTGSVELWLHNPTADALPHVAISVGALRSSAGHELASDRVTVEPAVVAPLPERSSRGIRLGLAIPADTPAERYRGIVLVEGVPDAWALLDVMVR
jgi:hypothetical protein